MRRFGLSRGQQPVAPAAVLGPLGPCAKQDLGHVALGRLATPRRVALRLGFGSPLRLGARSRDVTLSLGQHPLRRLPLGRLSRDIEVIAAAVDGHAQGRHFHDPIHPTQQVAVMADHYGPAIPARYHLGDQRPRLHVQMIGRLVQQDQVRLRQHQAGQPQPRLLATAQADGRSLQRERRQPHGSQRLAQPRLQRPVGLGQVIGRAVAGQHPRNDGQVFCDAQGLRRRLVRRRVIPLIQHTDRAGPRHHALGRRSSARDQAQQRALARAVAADDARALGAERQAQIIE